MSSLCGWYSRYGFNTSHFCCATLILQLYFLEQKSQNLKDWHKPNSIHPYKILPKRCRMSQTSTHFRLGIALIASIMTQPRPGKIFSTLGLTKARTILFRERPYSPKRVLPIKVVITRTRGAALIP